MLSRSPSPRLRPLLAALSLAFSGLTCLPLPVHAQTAVLTQNGDNGRTGANTAEATLTPASVGGGNFGRLFTIKGLNANVNGQTLYVPRVSVGGALHNVLLACTSNNADNSPCGLYAFDADTGAALWSDSLPNSATYTTATPTVDKTTGAVYVLTKTGNDNTGSTYLHAYDVATGAEKTGSPVQITASVPGTGDGSVGGRVSFDGPASSGRFHANDRAGLLLLNGVVYTSFAHNSDSFPYHGWIIGYRYDGTRFTQTAVFCTTPNGGDGGIWMAGKGLTADANGFIYCSVGNGTFDASGGGPDYGMCYLKLRAADLTVADWFAPFDEKAQSNQDLDLGNSGLTAIPGTNLLFGGATKFGSGFLLNSASLGRFTPGGPDAVVQRLDGITGNDSVGQNPIAWASASAKYVYLWAGGTQLQQFKLDPASGKFSPAGAYKETSGLTGGGSLAVSSAGGSGGILWAVDNGNVLRAFDATDVSKPELWNSSQNSARDALTSVGHFQFPTVVAGKVYVPTGSSTIEVYGLLTPPPPQQHVLWDNPDGKTILWNLNADGSYSVAGTYGPYADSGSASSAYSAVSLSTGTDGVSHLLWTNLDGVTYLWNVQPNGSVAALRYGPFSDDGTRSTLWKAVAVSTGGDNVTHVLWTNPNGRTILWDVSAGGSFAISGNYDTGAAGTAGLTASALASGPDGRSHVLWNGPGGQMLLWNLDGSNIPAPVAYGPFSDDGTANTLWSARALSVGPDNVTHVLWANPNGRTILWDVSAGGSFAISGNYNPLQDSSGGGFVAAALATGVDGSSRLVWNNPNGDTAFWNVTAGGAVTPTFYSPFYDGSSLWKAVAVSAVP